MTPSFPVSLTSGLRWHHWPCGSNPIDGGVQCVNVHCPSVNLPQKMVLNAGSGVQWLTIACYILPTFITFLFVGCTLRFQNLELGDNFLHGIKSRRSTRMHTMMSARIIICNMGSQWEKKRRTGKLTAHWKCSKQRFIDWATLWIAPVSLVGWEILWTN